MTIPSQALSTAAQLELSSDTTERCSSEDDQSFNATRHGCEDDRSSDSADEDEGTSEAEVNPLYGVPGDELLSFLEQAQPESFNDFTLEQFMNQNAELLSLKKYVGKTYFTFEARESDGRSFVRLCLQRLLTQVVILLRENGYDLTIAFRSKLDVIFRHHVAYALAFYRSELDPYFLKAALLEVLGLNKKKIHWVQKAPGQSEWTNQRISVERVAYAFGGPIDILLDSQSRIRGFTLPNNLALDPRRR